VSLQGGVFVIRRGGGVQYMHVEKDIGLPAPHEHVLEAAMQAAANAPAVYASMNNSPCASPRKGSGSARSMSLKG
jgi:hypothetical protein